MKAAVWMACVIPVLALATPGNGPGAGREAPGGRGFDRMRMMRVIALADALDLNETEALRMGEVMRKYDERRRPIRQQVQEASQILERAANGDASVMNQVDSATQRIFDARSQMAQLDHDMFGELTRGLSAEKRAKLAVFLARFDKQVRQFRQHRGMNGDRFNGPGGRRGMWQQQSGEDGPDAP